MALRQFGSHQLVRDFAEHAGAEAIVSLTFGRYRALRVIRSDKVEPLEANGPAMEALKTLTQSTTLEAQQFSFQVLTREDTEKLENR